MPPIPPPPSRPWYLVVAMLMTWLVGMFGLTTGFETARLLRSGRIPDTTPIAQSFGTPVVELLRAMFEGAHVTFPLAVAQALLAAMLMIASARAMSGHRGARSFALQAIAANALLALLAYALTGFLRNVYIGEVVRTAQALGEPERRAVTSFLEWVWRFKLVVLDLGPLLFAALALTRTRAKRYFDLATRLGDKPEDA